MPRLHLFEWEDQPWFPALIRDAGTAYLRLAAELTEQARNFVPVFGELLDRTGEKHIIDLCSGGAGPLLDLLEQLRAEGRDVDVTLTDLYPNIEGLEALAERVPGQVHVHAGPVDARDVPSELKGVRTLFNGLHHFRPEDARKILASAVADRAPIAVVELVPRHPLMWLSMLFAPIMVLFAVPFLRPFRIGWLPLTYLVPVIPLFIMWDGLVSSLRNYTPAELDTLTREAGTNDYEWDVMQLPMKGVPLPANVVIGRPT